MVGSRAYDAMYRLWAPWDRVGVREELRAALADGLVCPETHPRALDLGCGTGANAVHLAEQGFDVVGVDFSGVALAKARDRARRAAVDERCRFFEADLTDPGFLSSERGTFDLVVDAGTIDDLDVSGRSALAAHTARVTRPGALLLLWCFYGARGDLPLLSFVGPSKVTPGIEPGEENRLFGASFDIEHMEQSNRHMVFMRLRRRAS